MEYIAAGITMGALAAVMLLRRMLTRVAQFDSRFMWMLVGAVVISAVAGILVGSFLIPN